MDLECDQLTMPRLRPGLEIVVPSCRSRKQSGCGDWPAALWGEEVRQPLSTETGFVPAGEARLKEALWGYWVLWGLWEGAEGAAEGGGAVGLVHLLGPSHKQEPDFEWNITDPNKIISTPSLFGCPGVTPRPYLNQ